MIDLILWLGRTAVHLAILLALPPLVAGLIVKLKARAAGRQGPPVLQPYYDLARLWRKGAVYSVVTTPVFRLGPPVIVASTFVAGLLLPMAGNPAPIHFAGDLIAFAYVLALGRVATVLAALDTGSSFEGMGASREVSFSALAEPTFFLVLVAIGVLGHYNPAIAGIEWSLTGSFLQAGTDTWLHFGPAVLLLALALYAVLLIENSRVPIDDPTTHLELTMIHEVMVLDHSGPDFGLIEYGAAQKLFIGAALLVDLLLPCDFANPLLRLLVFLGGLVGVVLAIVLTEVTIARLKMTQVPRFLAALFLLAAFGVVIVLFEI